MADIRQSTRVLDDFDRPDEAPLLSTPEHPWDNGTIDFAMQLRNLQMQGYTGGNTPCWARWLADPQSDADGGVPEVWALRGRGAYTFPYGTRMALFTGDLYTVSGYALLAHSGEWLLRRHDHAPHGINIASSFAASTCDFPTGGDLQLLRLNGDQVEGWVSFDAGANWCLAISATDPTYRTGLYMVLGATGNEDAWDEFGGGPFVEHHTRIIRYIRN